MNKFNETQYKSWDDVNEGAQSVELSNDELDTVSGACNNGHWVCIFFPWPIGKRCFFKK